MSVLVELVEVSGRFPNQQAIFERVSWTWSVGEHWAIVGPVGSGKTSLLKILDGSLRITTGERRVNRSLVRVGFQENMGLFQASHYYYQQRFNFVETHDSITVKRLLTNLPTDSPTRWAEIISLLELENLLDQEVITLSTGQNRRLRIARALLNDPDILVLDDPFAGLDSHRRSRLADLLQKLTTRGVHLGLVCREEEIPPFCTHVLEVQNGRIEKVSMNVSKPFRTIEVPISQTNTNASEPIIELENVQVQYGTKQILPGVSWKVGRGERWVLFGENGAGKSTLLSLIVGDHPQAYANSVKLFGRKRGTGESIWELKKRIGFFSSEFQLYFPRDILVWEVIGTGFHDGVYPRPLDVADQQKVSQILTRLNLSQLQDRILGNLSAGEQRKVLLARALVKQPELLILDEPFQGLDWKTIDMLKGQIESLISPLQTVIVVTHDPRDVPKWVNRVFQLSLPKS